MELVDVRTGDCVAGATTKVEIRRGPFAISPQVNGACSCSEAANEEQREGLLEALREGGYYYYR